MLEGCTTFRREPDASFDNESPARLHPFLFAFPSRSNGAPYSASRAAGSLAPQSAAGRLSLFAAARNSLDTLALASMDLLTAVGGVAAFCTTVSYFPQLRKCWQTGHTGDLSLLMFLVLAAGVALWILYGVLKSDPVIILANTVSLILLLAILYFKLREVVRRK